MGDLFSGETRAAEDRDGNASACAVSAGEGTLGLTGIGSYWQPAAGNKVTGLTLQETLAMIG
jgi:hypothetical protein